MGKVVIRVRMEPELEKIAGHLGPVQRFEMANQLERWIHQLRVSGRILSQPQPLPRPKLRRLKLSVLPRN